MALTVSAGDPFSTFITGEVSGAIGYRSPLFVFGRGTGGIGSVLYLRNSDTATVALGEDIYAKGADAQNAFVVQSTNPT